jgi:redox-sensitive bicupin YhaK (pirin superfamily)
MSLRPVKRMIRTQPTMEGAGVRLQRAFGFGQQNDYDPFLLLDDFRNENPDDYMAGFPWHPHRGIETTRNAFAYVFAGSGTFRDASAPRAVLTDNVAKPTADPVYDATNHSLVLFDSGDEISVQAGDEGIRFLLVSGKPIEEPVAWYGPIVMNTEEQLRQAIGELHNGGFIKHR